MLVNDRRVDGKGHTVDMKILMHKEILHYRELPTYLFITFKVQSFCDSRTSVMIACLFLPRARYSGKRKGPVRKTGKLRPLRMHEEDLRNRLRNQYSLSNLARNPKSPFNKIERQFFVRLSCYLFLFY